MWRCYSARYNAIQRIMISESSTMHADRATVKINSQPNFHKERKFLGKAHEKQKGKSNTIQNHTLDCGGGKYMKRVININKLFCRLCEEKNGTKM